MSDESREPTSEAIAEPKIRDEKGRFLPGVSGNPFGVNAGRPKGSGMMAEIERQLALEAPDGRTWQERIVERLIRMADAGDTRACELILKRVAPERLALEGDLPLLVFRDLTGLGAALMPERAEPETPVVDVGEEDLPEDAEQLPDGVVRYRI